MAEDLKKPENYSSEFWQFKDPERDKEDFLIADWIHEYLTGERVFDLGCGPVVSRTSLFFPDAVEVVAVDIRQDYLDFNQQGGVDEAVNRALAFRKSKWSSSKPTPNISYVIGDIVQRLELGAPFDSGMQLGSFGCVGSDGDFQKAVDNAFSYLKSGGRFLMVNWVAKDRDMAFNFGGKVYEPDLYLPCLTKAGFSIIEYHVGDKYVGTASKDAGFTQLTMAVAEKR